MYLVGKKEKWENSKRKRREELLKLEVQVNKKKKSMEHILRKSFSISFVPVANKKGTKRKINEKILPEREIH